ncbi:MAG: FG-GAP-like repeat-containing protein [Pirellulales bacterium]
MSEPHPVQKSPPYHVLIWIIAGIVAVAVVYGLVQRANVPPPQPPANPRVAGGEQSLPALPKIPFTDITQDAGITFSHQGGATGEKMLPESGGSGCAWIDYDNDGDPDLLLINGKAWEAVSVGAQDRPNVLALYRNDKGKFTDVTADSGLYGYFYGQGAAVGDYDSDGDDDLLVTALGSVHLYRNDNGKFTDVSADSGAKVDATDWPTSAGFFDYDRDGDLDLFVVNYVRWTREADQKAQRRVPGIGRSYAHPEGFEGTQNYLFRNEGGRFTDVSAAAGIHVSDKATGNPRGKGLALTFVDFDRDGWLDVFVANDTVPHFLFRNRRDGTFEEVAADRRIALNSDGMATSGMSADAAWIRNNDELVIAVGNFADERTSFFVSERDGERVTFVDESMEAGVGGPTREMLTWGLLFDDFDFDRRVDMVQTNGHLEETIHSVQPGQTYAQRGQLFWNTGAAGPRILAELPAADIGDLAQPSVGRALSSADIDGDGDLDLVITSVGGPPRLLRNDRPAGNHFLRVKLAGSPGNPHGIGAAVELRAAGVTQRRTVMPTRSYLTQTEPIATFGLGDASEIESLNITWPDGAEQTVIVNGVDLVLTVQKELQTFAILGNIAKAQLENGEYQKAIATLERALKLKPESLAMRRNLARARFLHGQYAQALDELRRIEEKAPSAATAYLMGLSAKHLANAQKVPPSEAVAAFKRAVELDPNEAALHYQFAIAMADAGQPDDVNKHLQKTIDLAPLHGQAQSRLAMRIRRDPDKQEQYRALMRDFRRIEAIKDEKNKDRKPDDSTFEVCRYTNPEPPETDSPPPVQDAPTARFVAADITAEASGNAAERLPPLAGVAPLFLENDGRYSLVGVSPAGELVIIAFDDAGRAKVIARGEQPLGPVGKDAIVLVGNTRRDGIAAPPAAAADGTSSAPVTAEGDRPEIAIVTPQRSWFVQYKTTRGFSDLTEQSQLSAAAGNMARWVDLEHDGDIDLCVSSSDGFKVWRNNGDGTFVEATAQFVLSDAGPAVDMGAADFDGTNMGIDLVLAGPLATSFWRYELQGQFLQDPVAAARWPAAQRVIVDDFNNDGLPDLVLISPNQLTLSVTRGDGQKQTATGLDSLDAAMQLDDDNDGRLDVVLFGRAGGERKAVVFRNTGGRFSDAAQPLPLAATPRRGGLLALDFDGDCDTDLLTLDEEGRLQALRNESNSGNRQLKMSVFSNEEQSSPIGTRVEVRRDDFLASRWMQAELPVEIGVGPRTRVDTIQTLWMNGLARNQIAVEVDCKPLRIIIIEFKKTSSCPFLYAWIDGQWQFVTDLMGIAPLNVVVARGVLLPPDPDEIAVLGPAERFADGPLAARLRITNELREATLLDQVRLLAVDHAADVAIFSRDRVAMTGVEGQQWIAGRAPVAPRSAVGSDGLDRTAALAREDGDFADPGRVIPPPVVGFTEPLSIEFEFDDPGDTSNLFMALTGWYRFGTSSSNIAASQRGDLKFIWPRLEVLNADGQWQLVEDMIGLPAGDTKTIICDLAGKLPPGARRFRLTSSFEVRWDRLALYHAVPAEQIRVSEAAPATSDLQWHGFHDQAAASVDQPIRPNTARKNDFPAWFTALEGWCTRYGDVRPLVTAADAKLAILNAGDGATLEFPAAALPPREPGSARTLLIYSVGWVKSGDPNDMSPLRITPFPGSDAPVGDAAGGDWQLQYNTRWVPRDRFAPAGKRR